MALLGSDVGGLGSGEAVSPATGAEEQAFLTVFGRSHTRAAAGTTDGTEVLSELLTWDSDTDWHACSADPPGVGGGAQRGPGL